MFGTSILGAFSPRTSKAALIAGSIAGVLALPSPLGAQAVSSKMEPALAHAPSAQFRNSIVSVRLRLPKGPLIDAVNKLVPALVYREIGPVTDCHDSEIGRQCNYSYDIRISRNSSAEVTFSDVGIDVTVPFEVSGDASLRLGIGNFSEHIPFQGSFAISLRFKPSVRPDWCIDEKADVDVLWKTRPLVDFRVVMKRALGDALANWLAGVTGDWLTVRADEKIEKEVRSLMSPEKVSMIRNSICEGLREKVMALWHLHSIPVIASGRELFVNIDPQDVKYSGPVFSTDSVDLGVYLSARAYITTAREVERVKPFPNLTKTEETRGFIFLEVPLLVSLRDLKREAEHIVSHTQFIPPLPLPGLSVRLENIEPSVSGGLLKATIDYSLAHRWLPFSFSGQAIVSGRPRPDLKESLLVLDEVKTEVLLNSKILSWLFSSAIPKVSDALRREVARAARYSVHRELEESKEVIEAQINKFEPTLGVRVKLDNFKPILARVEVGDDGLGVYASAGGSIRVELERIAAVEPFVTRTGNNPFRKLYKVAKTVNLRKEMPRRAVSDDDKSELPPILEGTKDIVVHDCQVAGDRRYKWCKVTTPAGHTGWIHQYDLEPT